MDKQTSQSRAKCFSVKLPAPRLLQTDRRAGKSRWKAAGVLSSATWFGLFFWSVLSIVLTVAGTRPSEAGPVEDDVRRAHAAVDRVLADDGIGNDWRKYLAIEQLEQQLNLGDQANVRIVRGIRDRFAYDDEAKILKRSPYRPAYHAIEAWLARLELPRSVELPDLVRHAADIATLPATPSVRQTLAQLRRAVDQMDTYFDHFGSEEQKDWRTYLHWTDMKTLLAAAPQPNAEALYAIARRYEGAAPLFRESGAKTIENMAVALRLAVRDLRRAETTGADLKEHLLALANRLQTHLDHPTAATAEAVGEQLGWLRDRDLNHSLLKVIDAHYRRENLYINVSRRLAAAGIEFTEDVKSPIDVEIRGTYFRGENQTRGALGMQWVPNYENALVHFVYQATVATNAYGSDSGVTFHSQGTVRVAGEKQVTLDDTGLRWKSAAAQAIHESDIIDTNADGREIGYVYDEKSLTERAVERLAAADARATLDRRADDAFGAAQKFLMYKMRIPLMKQNAFPAQLEMRTSENNMMLTATQATPCQMAAATDPPDLPPGSDLSFRMHASTITNLAVPLFGGRTMTEPEIETFVDDYLGFVPTGLQTTDASRPWSVTFERQHPITLQLDDGILTVQLRADRFHVGEKEYPAMRIAARYQLAVGKEGLAGVRQTPLEILPKEYQAGQRLGARFSTFRTIFRKRFDRVFPESIPLDRFRLGGNWNWVGDIEIDNFSADDGWLALHYRLPTPAWPPADAQPAEPRRLDAK